MAVEYLEVSALNKYIKLKFDKDIHLKKVFLKGEISNFKHNKSGHFYFTLKDQKSQISAVMFSSKASTVKFEPSDGQKVLVTGHISVFEVTGNYQIYIDSMQVDGIGDLYVAFEQLKNKLQKEGLFNDSHKMSIPKYPNKVGVITSPTGAAIRDIINTISRRYPLCEILLYPAAVQGEKGKDSIIKALSEAIEQDEVDVIICGRGGGSIEDLWNFNEEEVARLIYNCHIPIISAVGHETDFTIADYVADLRAPTPTAAAEISVPNIVSLKEKISNIESNVKHNILSRYKHYETRINSILNSYIITNPSKIYENKILKLDNLINNLSNIFNAKFTTYLNRLDVNIEKLKLLNPLNILDKGYSLTYLNDNPISTVNDVVINDTLSIKLKDGILKANVIEKKVN